MKKLLLILLCPFSLFAANPSLQETTNIVRVLASKYPTITVSPVGAANGYPSNNNLMFGPDTPGTTTCGIQEAINALPVGGKGTPGGGTINLARGLFYTKDTINCIQTNQLGTLTINIIGQGITSTIVLNTNPVPVDLMQFDAQNHTNGPGFYMRDLCLAAVSNAPVNLLYLRGLDDGDFVFRGAIAGGGIENCLFGWWQQMTNEGFNIQGITTSAFATGGIKNLCAVALLSNFGSDFYLRHNTFEFVAGVSIGHDNLDVTYNQWIGCGSSPGANAWSATNVLRSGYVCCINDYGLINSLHIADFGHNHFVTTSSGGGYIFNSQYMTYLPHDDYFETSSPQIAVGPSRRAIQINCRNDGGGYYDITNTADWSKPFQVDTGLVQTAYSIVSSKPPVAAFPQLWFSNNTTAWILYTNGTSNKLP